jgi:hypothetical protein
VTASTSTIPAAAALKPSLLSYRSHRPRLYAAAVLPPVGAVLILLALHHAAGQAEPDQTQFALFWAGFLCGMLPLIALACSTGINGVTRTCALAGIGLFGTVGRMLRIPAGPLGGDEFIHLRQAIETYFHGDVGHGSGIFPHFFGLHQSISAFAWLTGSPLWPSGLTVIVLAHVLSVLSAYQLVRAVGGSASGAAAGAVVYTLNPSWGSFDTAVSYESLALPVLLWCLAAAVAASCAPKQPGLRYIAVVVLCAAALPMIHHLSTIMLCLILALLIVTGVVHRVRRAATKDRGAPREHLWPLLLTASCLLASMAFWWSKFDHELIAYLSPSLTRGWKQLKQFLHVLPSPGRSSGIRIPFGGAQNPIYEIVSGLLYPPVALALFLASLAVLWRNRRLFGSAPWGFAAVGAMFFLSIPMVVTMGGNEGAHRSWEFSFIGIAVVCGLAWSFGVPAAVVAGFGPLGRCVARFGRPGARVGVVGVLLTVMYFGCAALGTNISSRFPGSAQVGEDARSVSREGDAVAAWMAAHVPVDTPVLADRYVSHQVGSWVGRMTPVEPSATFPLWDLYMSAEPVRPAVLKMVLDADVRYFVVDARMATTRPRMGFWFIGDEPGAGGTRLLPQVAIDRFNCLPWLRARYAAGPLTVYQVDADVLRDTMAGSCERPDA